MPSGMQLYAYALTQQGDMESKMNRENRSKPAASAAPCRATVIAFTTHSESEDKYKCVRRSFECGYGAEKIAARWLARGYKRVSVYMCSTSTGKTIAILNKSVEVQS